MAETSNAETVEITFKTITQEVFKLTLPTTTTVGEVKAKIFQDKGADFEVDRQKLIYNGKVLEDTQILGDVKVDQKKYIVVMVSRKKVEQPVVAQDSSSKVEAPKTTTPVTTASETTTTTTPSGSTSTNAPASTPAVSAEQEETINNISAMGYPRDQVIRALRAAFGNADRAVEYLCTGIPESTGAVADVEGEGNQRVAGGEEQQEGSLDDAIEALVGGGEGNPLEYLRDSPQFLQLRQIVRAQPELKQAIRDNQEAFVHLLNEEAEGDDRNPNRRQSQTPSFMEMIRHYSSNWLAVLLVFVGILVSLLLAKSALVVSVPITLAIIVFWVVVAFIWYRKVVRG